MQPCAKVLFLFSLLKESEREWSSSHIHTRWPKSTSCGWFFCVSHCDGPGKWPQLSPRCVQRGSRQLLDRPHTHLTSAGRRDLRLSKRQRSPPLTEQCGTTSCRGKTTHSSLQACDPATPRSTYFHLILWNTLAFMHREKNSELGNKRTKFKSWLHWSSELLYW